MPLRTRKPHSPKQGVPALPVPRRSEYPLPSFLPDVSVLDRTCPRPSEYVRLQAWAGKFLAARHWPMLLAKVINDPEQRQNALRDQQPQSQEVSASPRSVNLQNIHEACA